MKTDYDVIIVGAGPAGITAAIYLKRANINCLVIEKETPGGTLNKTASIENYPGYTEISGPDLALKFYEHFMNYDIPYKYGEVTEIIDNGEIKTIKTKNEEITCKKIILAIGRKPKSFTDKNQEGLEGKGISFCALCDATLYKNEEVAIVGGGNSALEEALYLSDICKKVSIIHRRDELRGDKSLISKILEKDNIEIIYSSEIEKFIAKDEKLESLDLIRNGNKDNLKVKACFIFIGYEPATDFLKNLDILDEKGYIKVDENLETDLKGIFAVGDVILKEVYQIITASSDGAIAAVNITKDLS